MKQMTTGATGLKLCTSIGRPVLLIIHFIINKWVKFLSVLHITNIAFNICYLRVRVSGFPGFCRERPFTESKTLPTRQQCYQFGDMVQDLPVLQYISRVLLMIDQGLFFGNSQFYVPIVRRLFRGVSPRYALFSSPLFRQILHTKIPRRNATKKTPTTAQLTGRQQYSQLLYHPLGYDQLINPFLFHHKYPHKSEKKPTAVSIGIRVLKQNLFTGSISIMSFSNPQRAISKPTPITLNMMYRFPN